MAARSDAHDMAVSALLVQMHVVDRKLHASSGRACRTADHSLGTPSWRWLSIPAPRAVASNQAADWPWRTWSPSTWACDDCIGRSSAECCLSFFSSSSLGCTRHSFAPLHLHRCQAPRPYTRRIRIFADCCSQSLASPPCSSPANPRSRRGQSPS